MIAAALTPPVPRINWAVTCGRCGARIVGAYPGDVVLAADRHGWDTGRCRTCKRAVL